MTGAKSQVKSRGRPRGFDRDAALRAAMEVFWREGYEGASMAALTKAMGINAPSLYAAFGTKEGLFLQAMRLYMELENADTWSTLSAAPTARDAIHLLLEHGARSLTRPDRPHGCMLILGDTNTSVQNDTVHKHLCDWRRGAQARFEERMRRGIADGDVPAGTDTAAVAAFYMTVLQGLSLRARDGASRESLLQVVHGAVAAWDALIAAAPKPARKRAAR